MLVDSEAGSMRAALDPAAVGGCIHPGQFRNIVDVAELWPWCPFASISSEPDGPGRCWSWTRACLTKVGHLDAQWLVLKPHGEATRPLDPNWAVAGYLSGWAALQRRCRPRLSHVRPSPASRAYAGSLLRYVCHPAVAVRSHLTTPPRSTSHLLVICHRCLLCNMRQGTPTSVSSLNRARYATWRELDPIRQSSSSTILIIGASEFYSTATWAPSLLGIVGYSALRTGVMLVPCIMHACLSGMTT
ncbi:hypothetical protein GGR57DRAFT_75566 [Xylariaceae sp. FL1272]|nr:hypothetical protein GGR57DRAFT_75566 [Xylariaceae sp. FL1272]